MAEAIDRPETAPPPTRRPRGLPRLQEAGLVVVVLALGLLLSAYGHVDARPGSPNTFLNTRNLVEGVALPMSLYGIMAVGMTCVIISGGIDISVASIMALSGLVTAHVLSRMAPVPEHPDHPLLVAVVSIALPLGVGLACGLVNGALIVGFRMHPFIVTLATMSMFRSLANVLPFGVKTLPAFGAKLPAGSVPRMINDPLGGPGGLQIWPPVVMLAVAAIGYVYLRLTIWGRENYAVGGNEEASRFSGIHVGRVKLRVYAISGTLAGLAGLVSLGRFGTISTNTAYGYELTVVAAAVVGGASLNGGVGTAAGAILGTLILSMIENAIQTLHLNQEYRGMIVGLSILVAVALDQLSGIWRKRRAVRRSARRGFEPVTPAT